MLNGTTPEIQHRIWGLCGSPNVHVFYCIALTEICSSQDLYTMTLVCMNLSVTYYIFSWTIFDNRKELPRASRVPNSQQDIWALFELIFCLPIQTNKFQRRFFVFYVCFVTSIGVQIPNTSNQMLQTKSKRNPASEANFKLEANRSVNLHLVFGHRLMQRNRNHEGFSTLWNTRKSKISWSWM